MDGSEKKERKPNHKIRWIVTTVLSAFIIFCMLTGSLILGSLGNAVGRFFIGVFGVAAYGWFGALTVFAALKIGGKRFNIPVLYSINFVLMFALTVLLAHLVTAQIAHAMLDTFSFGEYLRDCFSDSTTFGGVLSALIIYPINSAVGGILVYPIILLPLFVTVYFAAKFFSDRKVGESLASTILENRLTGSAKEKGSAMFVENLNEPIAVSKPRNIERQEPVVERQPVSEKGRRERGEKDERGTTKQPTPQESARNILFNNEPPAENVSYTNIYEDENQSRRAKSEFETAPRSLFDRPPKIIHDNNPSPPIITEQNPAASLFNKRSASTTTPAPEPQKDRKPSRDLSGYKSMLIKDVDPNLPPIISGDAVLEQRKNAVINEKNSRISKEQPQAENDLTNVIDFTSLIHKKAEPLSNAVFGYASDYENHNQRPIISDYDGTAAPDESRKKRLEVVMEEKKEAENVSVILSEMFMGRDGMASDKDVLRTGPIISPAKKGDEKYEPLRTPFVGMPEPQAEERKKSIAFVEKPLSGGNGAQMSLEERENLPELPLRKDKYRPYNRPSIELLDQVQEGAAKCDDLIAKGKKLEEGLEQFGIRAMVENIISGPTVALFELELAPGISVKQVSKYSDDLARHIESKSGLRIIPHIPGKSYFGIEAPHNVSRLVTLRELIGSNEFRTSNKENKLYFTLGVDVQGDNVIADLSDMPHLLVGGSTGTGKSVCLNSLILSLMYKYSPDELRFILIDPKRVEFHMFSGMPHMLLPNAVVEPDKALNAFNYLIDEMERRYILFQHYKVKDLTSFNKLIDPKLQEPFPRIVLIVDELSDLMSFNKSEIESKILRLAQKARASGIHLVLATQRPSVDVVTGTIKSNLPARIALRVISQNDSKTILDTGGPEKLLGKGDMLFQREGSPRRVQGVYVSNEEVIRIVDYIKANNECNYSEEAQKEIIDRKPTISGAKGGRDEDKESSGIGAHSRENDPLFAEALKHVILANAASISMIQRKLNVGFGRAGNIVETMEKLGYVSTTEQNKARSVLITKEQYNEAYGDEYGEI